MKRLLCLLLVCALCAGLCSCRRADGVIYNTGGLLIEFDDYLLLQNDQESVTGINKQTDEKETLYMDPIATLNNPQLIMGYGREPDGRLAVMVGRPFYEICRVDLDTFEWKFDRGVLKSGVQDSYLGAEELFRGLSHGSGSTIDMQVYGFIPYTDGYILVRSCGVFLLNGIRHTYEKCLIEESDVLFKNCAYDGRSVYYISEKDGLISLTLRTARRTVLEPGVTGFFLTEKGIVFVRDNCLWLRGREQPLAENVDAVHGVVNDRLCYTTSDCQLRLVGFDGQNDTLLIAREERVYNIGICSQPPRVYYYEGKELRFCPV